MLTRVYVELDILKESLKERVYETLSRLRKEENGAALVEYGLLIAGIAVACLVIVFTLGTTIFNLFTKVEAELSK